jgi:hypothetical protein
MNTWPLPASKDANESRTNCSVSITRTGFNGEGNCLGRMEQIGCAMVVRSWEDEGLYICRLKLDTDSLSCESILQASEG